MDGRLNGKRGDKVEASTRMPAKTCCTAGFPGIEETPSQIIRAINRPIGGEPLRWFFQF